LTAAKAFTSLALITLMIGPATQLMQGLMNTLSASGCIDRMQKFLQESTPQDPYGRDPSASDMISVYDVLLGLQSDGEPTPITLALSEGSTTMISGTVGCGKSTLLIAILGERKSKSGSILVSTTRIGYCSPKPWVRNDTIKNNILSSLSLDEAWYETVLRACDLGPDLGQMPNGEDSLVGSRGITLSGGQKHRIALARALYARCPLLLLDDPFSSLDRKTRSNVANRLFGVDGLVRKHKITVVFVSHESKIYLPLVYSIY